MSARLTPAHPQVRAERVPKRMDRGALDSGPAAGLLQAFQYVRVPVARLVCEHEDVGSPIAAPLWEYDEPLDERLSFAPTNDALLHESGSVVKQTASAARRNRRL